MDGVHIACAWFGSLCRISCVKGKGINALSCVLFVSSELEVLRHYRLTGNAFNIPSEKYGLTLPVLRCLDTVII